MSDTINFSCDIYNNTPYKPLGFKISINDEDIFDTATDKAEYHIDHDIIDNKKTYKVKFILHSKTDEHTILGSNNSLIESSQIDIKNIKLDDIDITNVFHSNSDLFYYIHDHNDHSEKLKHKFNMGMGCNGFAEFTFNSPVYTWLLENM
jgi:hypothetical protein